ncbi:MAG: histidine phosphatase family protein [Acholeplasmataceae bacterium]
MTKFIFVRHGEPRYDEVLARGYKGQGYDLGRLTDTGIKQAEKRAKDPILKDAQLIISSPYTRALQTAAIISRVTHIKIEVENDLHEWMPDTAFIFDDQIDGSFNEYLDAKGVRRPNHIHRWESYDALKKRVMGVLEQYKHLDKVIVVCHGIVMSTVTHFDDVIEHCGIREVTI